MKTTVEKMKAFTELSSLPDASIEVFIGDAFLVVKKKKFPEDVEEMANRYLAAHLATMTNKNVVMEAVGTLKRQYSDKNPLAEGLSTTPYGQKYLELERDYVKKRKGINLVVI